MSEPAAAGGVARFAAVPPAFTGVWRRTLLEGPGLARDTASQVYWLQTAHWHGDLRLPPERPDFSACRSLADCSAGQRGWLARQKGFAGVSEVSKAADGTVYCQWHRQVDFQPPRPDRDYGRIVIGGDRMSMDEFGVDADYREHWVRLPQSLGATSAWRRMSEAAQAAGRFGELLLVAGACFFYLRDRPCALPPEGGLAAAADPAGALDMELSLGVWDGNAGTITHSSLPWREGQRLVGGGEWRAVASAVTGA